ncbi:FAD binding domain-containing protein [Streptomyces sp. NPDC058457]|uniref:FAD binding domain-containing protein n=1 Tax=Streptomyces sp. NPDC058457 TaxID=3346507 RepID=UPI00364D4F89
MRAFEYERPADPASALTALAGDPSAMPLAGGTNLVDLMRLGVERPGRLVDINRIDFGGVEPLPDGRVRIGAGVRNSDLAAHPLVRERFPVLAKALLAGASGQLRNRASVGGNLLQRTRCVYFTDVTKPCNKREPGSGCPAVEGASRELGILGVSAHCIATQPGDMAVALAALDAVVVVTTLNGTRSIPVTEFHRLPGDHPERDTELPKSALVTSIEIPGLRFSAVSTYRKARDRRSYAFALGSVAAALDVEDGTVRDVRLALGSVAPRPWRAFLAEDALRGGPATRAAFEAAADLELSDARTTEENAFKVPLMRRLVGGVLAELAGLATRPEVVA